MDEDFVWVLMPPRRVPPRWSDRGVDMLLVPLMPDEATSLLEEGTAALGLTDEEERVARLAARGESADAIAAELHMTKRSVYRRLARLRKRLGVENATQLAGRLSKLGF
ncbi:MAG: LuxR C-terminal-related transcriptional regulator [Actinomycetota bacterium]|nr:LuxR C-terminal-related transcriptional regulator [Actinomycetota bacterium]